MKRVLLAGEGPTELGDWWNEVPYRAGRPELAQRGVLEALLLRRVGSGVFVIADGVRWNKARLYQAGNHRRPETRRIRGLAVLAEERDCDVLVFSRDRDGDEERESQLEEGIAEAERCAQSAIVGGCAVEAIEAWLLALLGERRSEEHVDPKATLAARDDCRNATERSELIENANLDQLPDDATSLSKWLSRVDRAFDRR